MRTTLLTSGARVRAGWAVGRGEGKGGGGRGDDIVRGQECRDLASGHGGLPVTGSVSSLRSHKGWGMTPRKQEILRGDMREQAGRQAGGPRTRARNVYPSEGQGGGGWGVGRRECGSKDEGEDFSEGGRREEVSR